MARAGAFFVLAWLALAGAAFAQAFPELTGRIVDQAGLLPPDREAQLSATLEELEARTGAQLVVATVPSLQGYPIKEFGYRLGRHWGVGRAGSNDGVLLLVAPREREVRIEVGYGLEPLLTDALSHRIIERDMLPHFRAGDMAAGVEAGAYALAEQLGLSPEEARLRLADGEGLSLEGGPGMFDDPFLLFMIFIVVPCGLGLAASLSPPAEEWERARHAMGSGSYGGSSGPSGSSGFSGGGGSFGGGGASGRW